MPQANRFRHQNYTTAAPVAPYYLVKPTARPAVGSDEFTRRMDDVGRVLRESGMAAVYLVHGTFVGNDALGMLAAFFRSFPRAAQYMQGAVKQLVDRIVGDVGNYTDSFARLLESAINNSKQPFIPVRRFIWSGENRHIGRADAAVRLIDELTSLRLEPGRRVLLWGHSHAGNVFALMTHLLGGGPATAQEFFKAAEIYYRQPVSGIVDMPAWQRVRDLLAVGESPLRHIPLDVVTFGAPVRYGWDSGGYDHLLHFVNRRPAPGLPDYLAAFPPRFGDVLAAADGDYVQQLGIAGTNIMPSLFSWRSRSAENRLRALLQHDVLPRRLLDRLRTGTIVHEAGTTLLVDYGHMQGSIASHLAGHAVYTSPQWMLFHAEETARRFYGR